MYERAMDTPNDERSQLYHRPFWGEEVPELARSIVSAPRGVFRLDSTAPDGEGGREPIATLTEPFAIALAPGYEHGATTLLPPSDNAPPSLRGQLDVLDAFLASDKALSTRRAFRSPLSESVQAYLGSATFSLAELPPIYVSEEDLLRHDDRWLASPAWERSTDDRVDLADLMALDSVEAPPPPTKEGAFPPPPKVPQFKLGVAPSTVSAPPDPAPEGSSLSPVAATAPDEQDAVTRRLALRSWYAGTVAGLAVAAAAVLFLWNPSQHTATSPAPANRMVSPEPPLRPAATLDDQVAKAVLVVGRSAASVCASGEREARDVRVVVTVQPAGVIEARVDHSRQPVDLLAAGCVEQAFSRLRVAPFETAQVEMATEIHLSP